MMTVGRDGGQLATNRLNVITFEKWTKLSDFTQNRVCLFI